MYTTNDWLNGDLPPATVPARPATRLASRYPSKKTALQKIEELGLQVGMTVTLPDRTNRTVRRITPEGKVFVRGVRGSINVHRLSRPTA